MGYNISEISGTFTGAGAGGLDDWRFTGDLSDPSLTIVSGDFNATSLAGVDQGEAPDGYVFSPLSTTGFGTLTFNTTDGTFTFTIDRAAVIASGADQTVTFTVTGSDGPDSDTDTVTIELLICVVRGTLVETQRGRRPVETLVAGDLVRTRDCGLQPVRWIGSRRVSARELAADPSLRPIRIRQGALSPGVPSRDLLVSPQHRILIGDWRAQVFFGEDEILAPAKGLVNDHSVLVDHDPGDVEYFHVLFDRHQIILTEGAPTESFCPGPCSLAGLDRAAFGELVRLFPQFARDQAAYGPVARPSARVREAALMSGQDGARAPTAKHGRPDG